MFLIICLFAGEVKCVYCFVTNLLRHAPVRMTSVLVLYVFFRSYYFSQFSVETYCFADGQ